MLNLPNSDGRLSGEIPSTLGDLRALQWVQRPVVGVVSRGGVVIRRVLCCRLLSLYDNDLTGTIPSTLGNLVALT